MRDTYAGTYGGRTALPAGIDVLREWSTATFTAVCACGWASRRLKITDANRAKLGGYARNHRTSGRCSR